MISINFKFIGLTRLGFENARSGFEPDLRMYHGGQTPRHNTHNHPHHHIHTHTTPLHTSAMVDNITLHHTSQHTQNHHLTHTHHHHHRPHHTTIARTPPSHRQHHHTHSTPPSLHPHHHHRTHTTTRVPACLAHGLINPYVVHD